MMTSGPFRRITDHLTELAAFPPQWTRERATTGSLEQERRALREDTASLRQWEPEETQMPLACLTNTI